jgi:hypothetical protein
VKTKRSRTIEQRGQRGKFEEKLKQKREPGKKKL